MRTFFVDIILCVYLCICLAAAQISFPIEYPKQNQKFQYSNQAREFRNYDTRTNEYNPSYQNIRFPNEKLEDRYIDFNPKIPQNLHQYGMNLNILYVSNNNPSVNNKNHNENHNYDEPKKNYYENGYGNQNNDGFNFQDYRREDRREDTDISNVENHQNVDNSSQNLFGTQSSAVERLSELKPIENLSDRNSFDSFRGNSGDSGSFTELKPIENPSERNNFDAFQGSCTTVDRKSGSCVIIFNCEPYVGVLMKARSDASARSLLKHAHCGFEGSLPKVCCPSIVFSTEPPPSNVPFTTTTPAPITTTTTTTQKPAVTEVPEPPEVDLYDGVLPDPPVCGVSNASWSRVVGGVPAKLGDFPWMALLGYENRQKTIAWRCGGTLITNRHVLSAAHCLHNHDNDLTTIRLGELDLESDDDGATPIDIRILKKIKHEGYSSKAFTNDIAIIVLETTVTFTPLIRPVCLMKTPQLRSQTYENYKPIIAGWGAIGYRKESAPHLQVLQIPVVSNEFCAQSYANYKSQVIDKRVLCAGYKNGGKDACQGDSGGPLLQPIFSPPTSQTFFYQLGVVSYGKECALANFPGVYTRVTYFTSWVHDTVKKTRDL